MADFGFWVSMSRVLINGWVEFNSEGWIDCLCVL